MENIDIKSAWKEAPPDRKIGGQAVIEGVMMRGRRVCAYAVRKRGGEIETVREEFTPASDKSAFFRLPVLRGLPAFWDALVTGTRIMMKSAEIAGLDLDDDEPPSRFEIWLNEKFGKDGIAKALAAVSAFLGLVLSVGLFMFLPAFIAKIFAGNAAPLVAGLAEGLTRLAILFLYLWLVSKNPEIRRVFEYHGAEHKTINCFERGLPLNAGNVASCSRLHKRCGTSFLLIVVLISMVGSIFLHGLQIGEAWLRGLLRLAMIPAVAGLAYEFIKWAGKSRSKAAYALSYPGLCLQNLTTLEPDEAQIETAITALREVLDYDEAPDGGPAD
ncbi:MAG: DUF1385 domain-containing protein [Clostridiales bacterium]|jgi:uncharacterized protein YqhQ|nr:DUF1385 domain-containing protein [Clostridiales bacterium]